jgi:hypothetical protein
VLAISHHPTALVLELVLGTPLAAKPTSKHLLRCKWQDGEVFQAAAVVKICGGVASALAYLHARGIAHGGEQSCKDGNTRLACTHAALDGPAILNQ